MSKRNPTRELQAALDRLTPALRRDVEKALAKLRGRISLERLVDAIEGRNALALPSLIKSLDRDLERAANVVIRAFSLGATQAASSVGIGFTATRPLAAQAAHTTAASLVTNVSRETRKAIRTIVEQAFSEGLAPRDVAKLIKPVIGLSERQAKAVIAQKQKRITQGWTEARAQAEADRYTARLLKARADMIARTEIQKAATAGRQAAWQQARQNGLLGDDMRKTWIVTPDDRLCPICEPMDGVTVAIDEAFVVNGMAIDGPPAHPSCRCSSGLVSARISRRRAA